MAEPGFDILKAVTKATVGLELAISTLDLAQNRLRKHGYVGEADEVVCARNMATTAHTQVRQIVHGLWEKTTRDARKSELQAAIKHFNPNSANLECDAMPELTHEGNK